MGNKFCSMVSDCREGGEGKGKKKKKLEIKTKNVEGKKEKNLIDLTRFVSRFQNL